MQAGVLLVLMINNLQYISGNSIYGKFSISGGICIWAIFCYASVSPNGNLLADGRFTYTWDGENRLISTTESQRHKVEFSYDYMGRRISKTVSTWDSANNQYQVSSIKKFVYDGWNCIASFTVNGEQATVNESYLWGEDIGGGLQTAGGVGGLLAVNVYSSPSSYVSYFPCYDGNGNVTNYVNASGSTVANYEFDPFGRTIGKSGSKADEMVFRFSTKSFDKELDAYDYIGRIYLPEIGRWPSRDSIEEGGGRNLYFFCNNNPLSYYDFNGNESLFITYDDKNTMSEVNKVEDIKVKEIKGLGGLFDSERIEFLKNEAGETCNFKFPLQITNGAGAAIISGNFYFYVPHVKGNDGGAYVGLPAAPSLAHERGHANAYWEDVKPCAEKIYEKWKGKTLSIEDKKKIEEEYNNCKTDTYWFKSANYSNKATRDSMDNDNHFIRTWPKDKKDINNPSVTQPVTVGGNRFNATDMWKAK